MRVQMIGTGKIKEVASKVAHDLVDRKKAILKKAKTPFYSHRQMVPHRRDYKKR